MPCQTYTRSWLRSDAGVRLAHRSDGTMRGNAVEIRHGMTFQQPQAAVFQVYRWCNPPTRGMATSLSRAAFRLIIGSSGPEEDRRLDVSLIVGYQFLFSAMLMGVLTLQLPRITESWSYAVPALIVCYALSGLPAVLGLGLALRDEGARLGTIILSAVHALLEAEYIRRGLAPYVELTALRIAIDVAIIIVLNRRVVRRAFQLSPITLQLRG